MSTGKARPSISPTTTSIPRSPNSRTSVSSTTSLNGTGRSSPAQGPNSIARSARGSVKKPNPKETYLNTNINVFDGLSQDEARAEHAARMDELRTRVQLAETASEDYLRQMSMLQTRLNDSLQEQGKLEDQYHENMKKIENLESEAKQATRHHREQEDLFESERTSMIRDREEQKSLEEELRSVNRRLKDSLAQRDLRQAKNTSDPQNGDQFAPPSFVPQSDSQDDSEIILEKDRAIESLRLELAGAQIKIIEFDNMGNTKIQELEKKVLDTSITNARLMEENESFQLLLSEKTLNGDFSKTEVMHPTSALGSLAEELESAEGESENYRRLEAEARSLKDQNKALTLYIESIISRLLSHKEFENVLEKSPDLMSGIAQPNAGNKDKDLPPPPPAKDDETPPSILQRAKSVVSGPARRPRPISQLPPSPITGQFDENITKPTSVPLGRSSSLRGGAHRRSQSEMPMAAPIVNQMYRGPSSTGSGGPMSPGISPGSTMPRTSFFGPSAAAPGTSNSTSRAASGSRYSHERPGSSSNSTFSERSGEVSGKERNTAGSTNYTGAVMTQNRLRPLRLVQENRETDGGQSGNSKADEAARKKANRGSWMPGWFNRTKEEETRGGATEN